MNSAEGRLIEPTKSRVFHFNSKITHCAATFEGLILFAGSKVFLRQVAALRRSQCNLTRCGWSDPKASRIHISSVFCDAGAQLVQLLSHWCNPIYCCIPRTSHPNRALTCHCSNISSSLPGLSSRLNSWATPPIIQAVRAPKEARIMLWHIVRINDRIRMARHESRN